MEEISEDEFETVLLPRLHQASARTERAIINAVWRETARRRLTPIGPNGESQ
jgi:hypothetical protein